MADARETSTAGARGAGQRDLPGIFRAFCRPGPSVLLIVLLGCVAYSNVLHVPFLFDDNPSIVANSTIRNLGDWRALLAPPHDTTFAGVIGRPVGNISFALNYALSGLAVEGMHVTNVLIHLLAALVLLWLLRSTFRLRATGAEAAHHEALALIIALLWLLHPIQTEAVTYLAQRVESLASLFILLTLAASLRYHQTGRRAWAVLAVACFAIGLQTKEVAAVAPVLVVLYDRAFLFESLGQALRRRRWFYFALCSLWLPFGWAVLHSSHSSTAGLHAGHLTSWLYLRFQAGAILHYLRLVYWPSGLTFDYGEPGAGVPVPWAVRDWLLPGVTVVALLVASLAAWRRWPAVGFLGLAFFVLLAPSSSVAPTISEVVVEYRIYLALAPVLVLSVLALDRILQGRVWVLALVVVLWAALTLQRNATYGTRLSLWSDTVAKRPENPRAWVELGAALLDAGDRAASDRAYGEAVKLDTDYPMANVGLARSAALRGDCSLAVTLYERALKRRSRRADIHLELGDCLQKLSRQQEALEQYGLAVRLDPQSAEAHAQYAGGLDRVGRTQEALAEGAQAVTLKPAWAIGHYDFASVLIRARQQERARAELAQATTLDPGFVQAHHRLGLIEAAQGHFPEALHQLEEALRLDPSRELAMEDLAWLRATAPEPSVRNGAEAVRWATQADQAVHGRRVKAVEALAAAWAESGRFEEAIQTEQRALTQAASAATAAMRARLALYQQHQPYRETPTPP